MDFSKNPCYKIRYRWTWKFILPFGLVEQTFHRKILSSDTVLKKMEIEDIKLQLGDEIKEALFEVVEELLQTDKFKVRIEQGSEKGDNFVGIVYRIIFYTADEKRTSNLFLKIAPTDETRRSMFSTRPCFLREIFMFEKVLPYFQEFQESRDLIVDKDGFHEYSHCYKTIDIEPIECLFLQDLTNRNFTMINKWDVTIEHILLVMKALGKFHAISFALKDQEPEKFNGIVSGMKETIYRLGYNAAVVNGFNSAAMNTINSITDDKDAHLLEAVLRLYEQNQFDVILDCVNGSEGEPYSVLAHGDLWSNNTMFQCDEKNNPIKVCFIDWQICRYASPVLDIVYYIFCSTTRELRGRNYNIYLKTYHESLSNHILRLGSDPDKLFPYTALQEHLRKFGKFGLANASFILPFLIQEHDSDGGFQPSPLSDVFKKRLRDIVADMYQLGYI